MTSPHQLGPDRRPLRLGTWLLEGIVGDMATNGSLDPTNRLLLDELQQDARLSLAELGRHVGLSSPAVAERLQRLEQNGTITGYSAGVDPRALGLSLGAIIRIRPSPGQIQNVAELAQRTPEIVECRRRDRGGLFVMRALPARRVPPRGGDRPLHGARPDHHVDHAVVARAGAAGVAGRLTWAFRFRPSGWSTGVRAERPRGPPRRQRRSGGHSLHEALPDDRTHPPCARHTRARGARGEPGLLGCDRTRLG